MNAWQKHGTKLKTEKGISALPAHSSRNSGKIGMTDDDQPSNKMWGTMIIIVAVVIIVMM